MVIKQSESQTISGSRSPRWQILKMADLPNGRSPLQSIWDGRSEVHRKSASLWKQSGSKVKGHQARINNEATLHHPWCLDKNKVQGSKAKVQRSKVTRWWHHQPYQKVYKAETRQFSHFSSHWWVQTVQKRVWVSGKQTSQLRYLRSSPPCLSLTCKE